MKKISLMSLLFGGVVVLSACGPTVAATDDAGATAAQQTQVSVLVTQALASLVTGTATITLTPSMTPQPSITPSLVAPMISVSVDTNCRFGPGKVYDYKGGLMVGETAEILAKDPTGLYFYIRNPDDTGFCWVWGNYGTISGDTGRLPVFTPEPTPTPVPDFSFAYHNLDQCAVSRYVEFYLNNTGKVTWESFRLIVRNITHALVNTYSDNQFAIGAGCGATLEGTQLTPGQTLIVGSMPFMNFDPTGNSFTADLTLCTLDNQLGMCLTKTITFTP
jgi:hypothetical protein